MIKSKLKFVTLLFLIFQSQIIFAQQSPYGISLSGMEWGNGDGPYNVPTQAELNYYAGKGLKLIRLPILWEFAQPTLGGPLDPVYLSYVDSVVLYASNAGISINLDVHNYARYPYNGAVINTSGGPTIAQFGGFWKLLAAHFASQPAIWGYDIMNEPNNLGTKASGGTNYWFPIVQAAIDSIRLADKIHFLIIEGDFWSHANTWTSKNAIANNNLGLLVDGQNKLVFEAHQYFDKDGSGTYGVNDANTSASFSSYPNNVSAGVSLVSPFVEWINKYGFRGYLGEFGVPNSAYDASSTDVANWNQLLDNLLGYLQSNCILGTYWAGGINWPYTNYVISAEPSAPVGGTDASQMAVLQNYTSIPATCTKYAIGPLSTVTGTTNNYIPNPSINVYPNPTTDFIYLSGVESGTQVSIFDVTGQPIYQGTYTNAPISIADKPKGLYNIKLTTPENTQYIKVIVQ